MDIQIKFRNPQQRDFYYTTKRNQCFSGGFNNGKTYAGCFKVFTLLTTFPNYRVAIARQTFADLKKTTMQTFFKICPKELVIRHNEQDGFTELANKSCIYWLHLDKVDEGTLRGLEINSCLIDQGEEMEEKVYDVLDGRIGRWDNAVVPPALLDQFPEWPISPTGKHIAPSYNMLLCNPDTQFHFIYRKFHPDSLERRPDWFYVEGEWDPNLGSYETYKEALQHDEEWVAKYVRGQWGISNAQIHRVPPECLIDFDPLDVDEKGLNLLERIQRRGNLFRVLDHGDASPTACLWFAALGGVFICYREYYVPNQPISFHRKGIADLSAGESYSSSYADPQIFKKTAQKDGGFWNVSLEYGDRGIDAPPLYWIPADNNEFATRNRLNELLRGGKFPHPISGVPKSPGLYFIKKSESYPNGCFHAISELQSQRRKSLGYIDGKQIFCDDREESVADHAYDCCRYFVAMHSLGRSPEPQRVLPNTFRYFKLIKEKMKRAPAVALSN